MTLKDDTELYKLFNSKKKLVISWSFEIFGQNQGIAFLDLVE